MGQANVSRWQQERDYLQQERDKIGKGNDFCGLHPVRPVSIPLVTHLLESGGDTTSVSPVTTLTASGLSFILGVVMIECLTVCASISSCGCLDLEEGGGRGQANAAAASVGVWWQW
jgi:hypothetical protein